MPPKFGVPWPLHPDQALVEEAEEEGPFLGPVSSRNTGVKIQRKPEQTISYSSVQ